MGLWGSNLHSGPSSHTTKHWFGWENSLFWHPVYLTTCSVLFQVRRFLCDQMVHLETVLHKNFPPPERGRKSDYITSAVSQAPEQLDWFSSCFLIGETTCNNKFLVANTCRKQLKHNRSENRKADKHTLSNTIKKLQGMPSLQGQPIDLRAEALPWYPEIIILLLLVSTTHKPKNVNSV